MSLVFAPFQTLSFISFFIFPFYSFLLEPMLLSWALFYFRSFVLTCFCSSLCFFFSSPVVGKCGSLSLVPGSCESCLFYSFPSFLWFFSFVFLLLSSTVFHLFSLWSCMWIGSCSSKILEQCQKRVWWVIIGGYATWLQVIYFGLMVQPVHEWTTAQPGFSTCSFACLKCFKQIDSTCISIQPCILERMPSGDYLMIVWSILDDHSCVPFCFPQILEFVICAICRGALLSDLPGCLEHPRCLRKCVLYPSLYSYLLWRGWMDDLVHVPVVCQLSSVFWCLRSFRFVCQFTGAVACMIFPSYLKLEGTVCCQYDMQYAKFFLWLWISLAALHAEQQMLVVILWLKATRLQIVLEDCFFPCLCSTLV